MIESRLRTSRLILHPRSLVMDQDTEYGLVQTPNGQRLAILTQTGSSNLDQFEGENSEFERGILKLCPLSQPNAASLRQNLPWLNPRCLGLRTSAGLGDRLGIATPGHVRALRFCEGRIAPIFAQQSIREMQRTGRSPQQVIDDTTWGIFEEGWQSGIGADADHLKTKGDIDVCFAAGYTFFTLDPGQYVDDQVDSADLNQLEHKLDALPDYLRPQATGLLGKTIDIEGYRMTFDRQVVYKAVAKYGLALQHILSMYEYLQQLGGDRPVEVEISMDETGLPTSPAEHIYLASELLRLGVKWVSFAPHFVGRFEKGVDYSGNLEEFEAHLAIHAAIARQYGPYKLSLHSGSDKFSIYPLFTQHTRGLAHLKTAGTSYLEALRTIAICDRPLFLEIYAFAREHFEADKKTYHISAQLNRAALPDRIPDGDELVNQFDARQILHVTFGSVLSEKRSDGKYLFYDRLMGVLKTNREQYFGNLEKHFKRHLEPFLTRSVPGRTG